MVLDRVVIDKAGMVADGSIMAIGVVVTDGSVMGPVALFSGDSDISAE